MTKINVSGFWRYVSNFFNYLNDKSRDVWEYFWEGVVLSANDMIKAASRFIDSSNPETSFTSPTIDFYEINIDILKARPTNIDLTQYQGRYNIVAKSVIKSAPINIGRSTIYNDMVEIDKASYFAIKNIAVGQYLVINNEKYFKISDVVEVDSGKVYAIELSEANLSYLSSSTKISIYLTNGKVFKIDDYVIDMPEIHTKISSDDGRIYYKDSDYSFSNGVVEFYNDIVDLGYIANGTSLYGKNVPTMETNIFNSFGSLVDVIDWKKYGNDNISAKALISSLLKGLQNPTSLEEYRRCLNLYYGLPVAPEESEVIGLFESFDYVVEEIIGDRWIRLSLKNGSNLHPFVQPGTKFIIDGSDAVVSIDYNEVIDRVQAILRLVDDSDVLVGSKLNVKLANSLDVTQIYKPTLGRSVFTCTHHTDGGEFDHITNYIYSTYDKYPEMLMYDNMDNYYHFVSCSSPSEGYIDLTVDDFTDPDIEEPKYNDYVDIAPNSTLAINSGKMHIPWPTHKYLLLRLSTGELYKCYLDAPIDTIYDTGDIVDKYTPLARCVDIMNNDLFPGWNEFSRFKSSGIDLQSNILELAYTIPDIKYGSYFPI